MIPTPYTVSVGLSKRNSIFQRIKRKLTNLVGKQPQPDNSALIRKYAAGKSFADIGCLWGVDGKHTFLAEESGATRVVGVDVYPASQKFLYEHKKRHSKAIFLQGDINSKSTTDAIGIVDLVLCSGVLYHTPDPVHLLTRLRSICGETLILNTSTIPEMHGVRNGAVFYPFLDKSQRKIWNRGIGSQKAITADYEPLEGYGNWFWGFTPSCLESMLACAGFTVKERYVEAFNVTYVCTTAPIQFVASSGEWNTPKDPEFLKFHR